nr:MAG TPA: hypothetical protein [Caudoviricetes sp.]
MIFVVLMYNLFFYYVRNLFNFKVNEKILY